MDTAQESGWPILKALLIRRKRGLLIATGIGIIWSLARISIPRLTRSAIDHGIRGDDSLLFWAGLITVVAALSGGLSAWRRYLSMREARHTESTLREQIFAHVQILHVGYHDHTQTGQLMSRSSSDLQQVQFFFGMVPLTAANLALVIGVVIALVTSQPLLALVALAPLPLFSILAQRYARRIHPAVKAVQAEQAQLATVVEETVSGVRVIKGFGAEEVQARKLAVEANDIRRESMRAARIRAAFMPALELLPNIGLIAVLAIGGHRVLDGSMTYGGMVEFMQYILLLVTPLRNMGMTVAFAQRASTAMWRVNEVLSTVPEVADPERPVPLPDVQPRGAVRFDDVTFAYTGGTPVLDGFSLDIAPGSSVAIVGATGSGKSTIARLLTRFYDVGSGCITLEGVDIRDLTLDDLRHAVSIVFEDTFLFDDTVRGNIAFARPDASIEEVTHAATLAGAHDFVLALPDGYDTRIGERGFSLSGGQRQRIAIARAVLSDPRVLVLDDATSAVDPSKEHEIREAMATVMRNRTTIVIAHRAATIALADRAVLLVDGKVAAAGRHDELLATSQEYRSVLAAYRAEEARSRAAAVGPDPEPQLVRGGD